MGLDQQFLVSTTKLTRSELEGKLPLLKKAIPLIEFRKHDQLQGYMEMLADRQGLIDLFDRDETFDYDRFEKAVNEAIKQLQDKLGDENEINGKHMVSTKYGNVTLEISAITDNNELQDGRPVKRVQLGIVYPKQGRKGRLLDGYVRLGETETRELVQLIEDSFKGKHQFPSCPGFFYGETEEGDWELTHRFLTDMLERLDWNELCLLYKSSW